MAVMHYARFRAAIEALVACRDDMGATTHEDKRDRQRVVILCQRIVNEYGDMAAAPAVDELA